MSCARHGIAPHAIQRTTPVITTDPRFVSAVTTANFYSEIHPKWDIRVMAIWIPKDGSLDGAELIGEPAHEDDLHYWSGSKDL